MPKTKQSKTKRLKRQKKDGVHFRQSKSDDFLEKIRENNPMIDYFTRLTVMNPAAKLSNDGDAPRREGSFVRLAHAREEFTAPVLTKGKSVARKARISRKPTNKRKKKTV